MYINFIKIRSMICVLIFLSSMLSKHIYCDIKTKYSNNYDYLVLGVGHCGFILPKPANQSAIFTLKYMGKSFLLDYLKPVGAILINTQGAI
jgi:hypothetical protein